MHFTWRVMSLKPPWSMVKSTEQRERKAQCGPFLTTKFPTVNATMTRIKQQAFFAFLGELGGSDSVIVENQTQTTELDSNYWQGVSGNWGNIEFHVISSSQMLVCSKLIHRLIPGHGTQSTWNWKLFEIETFRNWFWFFQICGIDHCISVLRITGRISVKIRTNTGTWQHCPVNTFLR